MVSRQEKYYARQTRFYRSILIVIAAVLLAVAGWQRGLLSDDTVAASAAAGEQEYVGWKLSWQALLSEGVPGLAFMQTGRGAAAASQQTSLVQQLVLAVTAVDIADMRSVLRAEILGLRAGRLAAPVTAAAPTAAPLPKRSDLVLEGDGKVLVGIYHTHTAESYVPSSGVTHKPGGQAGDITRVGQALAERLAAYRIGAAHSMTIHDYPSFMKAYGPAEVTARNMLAEHPQMTMIFDIHRDAESKEHTTAVIAGFSTAKIAIVVAAGHQELAQPNWQQNLAFAKELEQKMNERYPGLSRGIQVVDWRYNQHLHPHALLLEVGCQENTLEEAQRSMAMLGDVVAEWLAEHKKM